MKNKYEVLGDDVAIFLAKANGEIIKTIIDIKDFDLVNSMPNTWFAYWDDHTKGYYVRCHLNKKTVMLHRFITDAQKGEVIDHINHDTLLNKKVNLNKVSVEQNNQNARKRSDNTSGYSGVYWYKSKKKWRATISVCGKIKSLGYFFELLEAVKVVEEARRKIHYQPKERLV